MNIKSNDEIRNKILLVVTSVLFLLLMGKAIHVSVIQGNTYADIANNKIYRRITVDAPRGEIRDRYGTLLAGNREAFSVEIYPGKADSNQLNETVAKIVSILEKSGEKIIDEFPIAINNNQYEFTYDQKVIEWKKANGIPLDFTAEQTFDYMVDILSNEGAITIHSDDDKGKLQEKIIEAGYYPPISISKNEFSETVKKQDWLRKYLTKYLGKDEDKIYSTDAKEAFSYLRKYYTIDPMLSDEQARKILNIRYLISQKGYYQYEPTVISKDIKKETVAKIEENSINMNGVGITANSVRYYPLGHHASHILGQLGKISSQEETKYYVEENGYSPNDIIGKTGIEKSFESTLRGEKGYTQVQVDVGGRLVETLDRKDSTSGDTVYLTIDSKLQQVAEQSLEKTLKAIQSGSYYNSIWGNMRMRDNQRVYNKAQSGAVVVLDIKNGDVLALASYPDYDPNLFVQGISSENFEKLTPANLNDLLAPKPLYNIATMTTVEPGSTFKMVTGITGIELGLSPYYQVFDKGYIEMGGQTFGCWLWNQQRGSHGPENLMDALRDSCNYYFYSVSTGYDYSKGVNLPINIKAQDILEYAKKFGLDEKTGVQIEELSGKVPSTEGKSNTLKAQLRFVLNRMMKNYFEGINSESPQYAEKIETIVNWMDENPSRNEIIKRLTELGVKEEYVLKIVDLVKYSYYNQSTWQTGDSFNMSIGQGDHKYSPIQMARYVSAIANDGYLNDINIVDKTETADKKEQRNIDKLHEKIELKNANNVTYIRQGMQDVTDEGSASSYFRNFPIKVASKTGTAQKAGKIPVADEEAYLLKYLYSFGVNKSEVIALTDKLEKEDKHRLKRHIYMQRAIFDLNPNISIKQINQFKDSYDPFAWFVSYAPADKPEIAVVTLIFQGGHGGFGSAIARDVFAEYFNLVEDSKVEQQFNFDDRLE